MKIRYAVSLFFSTLALGLYQVDRRQFWLLYLLALTFSLIAFLSTRQYKGGFMFSRKPLDEREIAQAHVIDSLTINISTIMFFVLLVITTILKLVILGDDLNLYYMNELSRPFITIPGFTFINAIIGLVISFKNKY